MINDYTYETLTMFNSLNEDFSIWQCKLMILEHNIIISDMLKSESVKDDAEKTYERVIDRTLGGEKRLGDAARKINDRRNTNSIKLLGKKLVELFEKIIAKFLAIFKKFKEVSIKLFASNEKWLSKYKSYILNADLSKIEYKHEIFAYWDGADTMRKFVPRRFNPSDKRLLNNLSSVKTYQDYLVKTIIPVKSRLFNNKDFIGSLKDAFRGNKVANLKVGQLRDKLMGMYKYCANYKTLSNELQKQVTMIEQAGRDAQKLAKDMSNGNVNNKVNPTDPNNAKENKSESVILLHEMVNEEQSQGDDKVDTNKYKVFLNVNTSVLSCKMEIMEEKYHAYMALLRAIVNESLKQTKKQKGEGDSYDNRTSQIDDSRIISDRQKGFKQKRRNRIR